VPTGIFYAFGYIHAHETAIFNNAQGLIVRDLLNGTGVAGLLLAVIAAPLWVLLARHIPVWLLRRSCCPDYAAMPVALCGARKSLDLALVLVWCLVCMAAIQFWGVGKQGLAAALLCGGLLTLARIDLETGLLPDILTLSLMWSGMLFHLSEGWVSLSASVAGAACGYGLLWLIFTMYKWKTGREGMGFGDFKLAAALGAWLGVMALPAILLYSSLSGALAGLLMQRYWRLPASSAIPFGPFLAVAGILVLFCEYAPRG
jgi:leader peptidase (prepilin peptidase)/N-methyltransferase